MSGTYAGAINPSASLPQVTTAIARASESTGVEFDFLLAQARIESGLNSSAKAPTSSATGLFQFIETTWLSMMQRHGAKYGLGDLAGSIQHGERGPFVSDPAIRGNILALRKDPQIASLMAAELAQENRAALMPILGREPGPKELYLAHFLGSSGAKSFLQSLASQPDAAASHQFGSAAKANRAIFFTRAGAPRSFAQVMEVLDNKVSKAMSSEGVLPDAVAGSQIAFSPAGSRLPIIQAQSGARFAAASSPIGGSSLPAPPALQRSSALPPMSSLLERSFDGPAGSSHAADHARRAYAQLKAIGL